MANHRLFDIPAAAGQITRINALQVGLINIAFVDPLWYVAVRTTVGNENISFTTEQEARDFFDLWSARVENAS